MDAISHPRKIIEVRAASMTLFASVLLVCVIATVGWLQFGRLSTALAYVKGERLMIVPRVKLLGGVPAGESRSIEFRVSNWTGHAIRILGTATTCTCIVVDEFTEEVIASGTSVVSPNS